MSDEVLKELPELIGNITKIDPSAFESIPIKWCKLNNNSITNDKLSLLKTNSKRVAGMAFLIFIITMSVFLVALNQIGSKKIAKDKSLTESRNTDLYTVHLQLK